MSRLITKLKFRPFWKSKQPDLDETKVKRTDKIVAYVKNIFSDYRDVAVEIAKDMKEKPVKSGAYISLITGTLVLWKTRPSEQEYRSRLTESVTDLMMVGQKIRNPKSETTIDQLASYSNEGRLKFYNLVVCSLMCLKTNDPEVKLYSANCKYIEPHWTEWYKTIVDVGVFGKWMKLEEAMKDFDINPDEWMEDGQPNKSYKHFKKDLVSWDMKIK